VSSYCKWCLLATLEDDCVSGHDGRSNFRGEEDKGRVPGNDGGCDAEGLPKSHVYHSGSVQTVSSQYIVKSMVRIDLYLAFP
jgi:hypothetical protein